MISGTILEYGVARVHKATYDIVGYPSLDFAYLE